MKKSSLGRKSSIRDNIPRRTDFNERKTGIPLLTRSVSANPIPRPTLSSTMRDLSADRVSTSRARSPCNDRMSEYRRETLRTPRSLARSSGRPSSLSGKKGDHRPLADKEWQAEALKIVLEALSVNMEGANIVQTYKSKKPMPIPFFIQACDFFLNILDEKITINQANYLTELPFILRMIGYKGKIDKTMLQTVNTIHVWPYALGVLHFLAELVLATEHFEANALDIMYPDSIETEASDAEDINFKYMLPCLQYLVKNLTADQSVEELVDKHRDRVLEVLHLSGLNDDILMREEEMKKKYEEKRKRSKEQMDMYSDILAERKSYEDELTAVEKETQEIEAEIKILQAKNAQELKAIADLDDELCLLDQEYKGVENVIAQSGSSTGFMSLDESERNKSEIDRLREEIKLAKMFAHADDLKSLELDWSIAELKQEVQRLFVNYTNKAKDILEHDGSIKDAISHSRPSLGQIPCNKATATLLERMLKSYNDKITHIETEIKNFDYEKKKIKLTKEVNEAQALYNKLISARDDTLAKFKQGQLELEKELDKALENNNKLKTELKSTEESHAENAKEYAEKEAQFNKYEDLLRKYYTVCESKLETKKMVWLDFQRRCKGKEKETEQGLHEVLEIFKKFEDVLKKKEIKEKTKKRDEKEEFQH